MYSVGYDLYNVEEMTDYLVECSISDVELLRDTDCRFSNNRVRVKLVERWKVRLNKLFRSILKRIKFNINELDNVENLEYRACQHPRKGFKILDF